MSTEYQVIVEPFADRHYIKQFKKKYGKAWDAAWKAQLLLLRKFDLVLQTTMAETITQNEALRICKTEFRVAGNESRATSGNRCIVLVDSERAVVRVLLVYHKSHIVKSGNETVAWKRLVKENFPQYQHIL